MKTQRNIRNDSGASAGAMSEFHFINKFNKGQFQQYMIRFLLPFTPPRLLDFHLLNLIINLCHALGPLRAQLRD